MGAGQRVSEKGLLEVATTTLAYSEYLLVAQQELFFDISLRSEHLQNIFFRALDLAVCEPVSSSVAMSLRACVSMLSVLCVGKGT